MTDIVRGTVLKAKPHHPIYRRGGDGIVVVTDNGHRTDFFTFMWVNGDPAAKGFIGDTGAIRHLDSWFEVIPDERKHEFLPADFVMPPDFKDDPEAAFAAMFR